MESLNCKEIHSGRLNSNDCHL